MLSMFMDEANIIDYLIPTVHVEVWDMLDGQQRVGSCS